MRSRKSSNKPEQIALHFDVPGLVAGVDEAGRGPLAGPVVAAAVILDDLKPIEGLADSKVLTARARDRLYDEIRAKALCCAIAEASVEEIDRLNIYRASLTAMGRAVEALKVRPQHVLTDARRIPGCDLPQEPIVGGDALCHAIAAASILAKTTRDALMRDYEQVYPGYGFAEHKGYTTAGHRDAIRKLGPCPIHRKSFLLLPPPTLWD